MKLKFLCQVIVMTILASVSSAMAADTYVSADSYLKWSITVESCDDAHTETALTFDRTTKPIVTKDGNSTVHTYYAVGGKKIDVSFTFTRTGKGLEITSTVKNDEEGIFVKKVTGAIFNDTNLDLDKGELFVSHSGGLKYNGNPDLKDEQGNRIEKVGGWAWNKKGKFYEMNLTCPSTASPMQYWVYTGKKDGLYVASHDPEFRFKRFIIRYFPKTHLAQYGIEHIMTCFSGQTYKSPVDLYYGIGPDWHEGADIYSAFFHANVKAVEKPEWVDHSSGWMLVIMKQQNAEIIWPYSTISNELTDIAKSRGYNLIGLLGWTEGGHDRWYPEYNPDPAMGGESELRKGIAEAQKKGMKIITYVNGQLIDTEGTKFWPQYGDSIVVRKKDGSDYHQMWQKYKDCPARHHGMACQSTEFWKESLLNLAKQANDLGADGIIFDQLGTTNVSFCYAKNHGHSVPAIVYERDKYENLKYVQESMKAINPNFIVITEGICEAEINSISMFHLSAGSMGKNQFTTAQKQENYINGSPYGSNFEQMFKYTIPEWTSTDRTQSPVAGRMQLNYDMLCGKRPEMEIRYMPDRQYLLEGRKSQDDDYVNMVSKVDISEIQNLDAEATKTYTRQVNEFLLQNSDLFFAGRFVDTKGYSVSTSSKALRSSAYVNGNKMGVVVWNASNDDAASYIISAKGYKMKTVISPDANVSYGQTIAPQSVHFVIFEK